MVAIRLINSFKKVSFMTPLFFCFIFNDLHSQNYTSVDSTYRSYYSTEYREYLPIQNCIFIINHEQLLEELKNYQKALVYTFVNGCKSKYCLPLYTYENWCKENGYKLFLVMVNIKDSNKTTVQNPNEQLYVIDKEFYKKRRNLSTQFENGLKQQPLTQKNKYQGNLFVFEKGKYIETYRELPYL